MTLSLPAHTGHFAFSCVGHIVGDLVKALRLAVRKGADPHFERRKARRGTVEGLSVEPERL